MTPETEQDCLAALDRMRAAVDAMIAARVAEQRRVTEYRIELGVPALKDAEMGRPGDLEGAK